MSTPKPLEKPEILEVAAREPGQAVSDKEAALCRHIGGQVADVTNPTKSALNLTTIGIITKRFKESASTLISILPNFSDLYGTDEQILLEIAAILNKVSTQFSRHSLKLIIEARCLYGADIGKFKEAVKMFTGYFCNFIGIEVLTSLVAARDLHGGDIGKFKEVAQIFTANFGFNNDDAIFKATLAARDLHGGDIGKFKEVAQIFASVRGSKQPYFLQNAILEFHDLYGTDISKFREVAEVIVKYAAKLDNPSRDLEILATARSVYGNNIEIFKIFGELNCLAVEALAELHDLYGTDIGKLREVAVVLKSCSDYCYNFPFRALLNEKDLYGTDIVKFREAAQVFAGIVYHDQRGIDASRIKGAFAEAKPIYRCNLDRFRTVGSVAAVSEGEVSLKALVKARDIFGDDNEKLKEVANVFAKVGNLYIKSYVVNALLDLRNLYGDDIEKLKEVAAVFVEVSNVHDGATVLTSLPKVSSLFGTDMEKFKAVADILTEVCRRSDCNKVSELAAASSGYTDNIDVFKVFAAVAIEKPHGVTKALADAKNAYGNDVKVLSKIAQLTDPDAIRALHESCNIWQNNPVILTVFIKVAKKGPYRVKVLAKANCIYEYNLQILNLLASYTPQLTLENIDLLITANNIINSDLELARAFIMVLVVKSAKEFQVLKQAGDNGMSRDELLSTCERLLTQ